MGKSILLVDDEPDIVKVLMVRLKSSGYEVKAAGNAAEAIETLKSYKPNLILLDYYLPDKNGLDLCLEIKANEDSKNLPIIFISASAESIAEIAKKGGANDYLVKPVESTLLIEKIEKYIT